MKQHSSNPAYNRKKRGDILQGRYFEILWTTHCSQCVQSSCDQENACEDSKEALFRGQYTANDVLNFAVFNLCVAHQLPLCTGDIIVCSSLNVSIFRKVKSS